MRKLLLLFLFPLIGYSTAIAQLSISFPNASFEENYGMGGTPKGWFNCIFDRQTNIDIHSKDTYYFEVEEKAYDGDNFIGMVTRADGTYETIGCQLSTPLVAGQTYFLQFYTNRSNTYYSLTTKSRRNFAYFNNPVVVQIKGGNRDCKAQEILAVTATNSEMGWQKQGLVLKPKKDYDVIFFNPYFPYPDEPINGNVLIDKIEPIQIYNDTIRYQALCLNGEYVCTLDKETLNPQKLKAAVLQYNKKILSSPSADVYLSKIEYPISLVHQLQEKLNKKGILDYIFNERSKVQRAELQALQKIGAVEEWEILAKGLDIHRRGKSEEISAAEQAFFENIPESFLEINQMERKLLDYIWLNRESLLNGFGRCVK